MSEDRMVAVFQARLRQYFKAQLSYQIIANQKHFPVLLFRGRRQNESTAVPNSVIIWKLLFCNIYCFFFWLIVTHPCSEEFFFFFFYTLSFSSHLFINLLQNELISPASSPLRSSNLFLFVIRYFLIRINIFFSHYCNMADINLTY